MKDFALVDVMRLLQHSQKCKYYTTISLFMFTYLKRLIRVM